MSNYKPLISLISEKSGVPFRAASSLDLSKLEALGLPQPILDFYGSFEPSECIEGQVRLWPIQDIAEENTSLAPGCYSSKHGFIVFATTFCGDTYCFDIRHGKHAEPGIVLISHEAAGEDTTSAGFVKIAKPVAQSLHEFLNRFIREEIDEECIYE